MSRRWIDQKPRLRACGLAVGRALFAMDVEYREVGGQMAGNDPFDLNVGLCLVVTRCLLRDVRDLQARKPGLRLLAASYCGFRMVTRTSDASAERRLETVSGMGTRSNFSIRRWHALPLSVPHSIL